MTEDEGFSLPGHLPQLENEALKPVAQLIAEAPPLDESMFGELLHMTRNSVAVRAALNFVLLKGREAELGLRNANDFNEVLRLQGKIQNAVETHSALVAVLTEAEEAKENPNAPQE